MKPDFRPARSTSASQKPLFSRRRKAPPTRRVSTGGARSRSGGQIGGRFQRFLMALGSALVVAVVLAALLVVAGFIILRSWLTLPTDQTYLFVPNTPDKASQPVLLVHAAPQAEVLTVITLESALPVTLPGGYGEYKVGGMYALLTFDHHSPEEIRSLLSLSVQRLMSRIQPVQSVRAISSKSELRQLLLEMMKSPQSQTQRRELLSLLLLTTSVPDVNMTFSTASSLPELQKKVALLPPLIAHKECSFAVVNGTEFEGVATKVSQVIERSGGVVVNVSQAPSPVATSQVVVSSTQAECFEVAELAASLLPNVPQPTVDDQLPHQHRAEIVIVIGTENADVLR
jgi:hypothetical protein